MGNRGIGGFPCYPPQAHTKEEVIKAITKKRKELQQEIKFFDDGLRKIGSLEEKKFYELTYLNEILFFVQCWKFGRDHAEFRIFSSNFTLDQIRMKASILRSGGDILSLAWCWDWETKSVDYKDAALYVGHAWKTPHYEKLLKGKYRSLKQS